MSLQIHRHCCTLHCPAKLPTQSGQKGNRHRCAVPAPIEGRTTQNMHLKTGARQRKDVSGSVSSCSLPLCGRSTNTFPHTWMTCLQIDSLSHWTLHDIVFYSFRFSAQRQLMPYFTRPSIDQWSHITPCAKRIPRRVQEGFSVPS